MENHFFWTNGVSCSNGGDGTVSPDIFLSYKFGITAISGSGGCNSAQHLAFDNLGRPYHGTNFSQSTASDSTGYMKTQCAFTFTMSDGDTFSINIEPETGYAYIVGQESS